ncbi:helix-turn-helix transcriptional regulator [Yoonia litorea]|uniref:Transcriptional regulator, AlpA family n=1 Tax=Yoonia litorea TaxID=1123755 RepID=A0A1I6MDR3_9RHOB|nr:AlpA family phage regulatory protein [Yoonia litorea]SFS13753.1 transcriptional regulator, AlpA family [Yoonia litorea]
MTPYLNTRDVQQHYRIGRSTLYRWQTVPDIRFPKPLKIGHRLLWRESDLVKFDERISAR